MAKIQLFIDMGSYSTVIYRENFGIVLDEPTKILLENSGGVTEIVDYGQKAVKAEGNQNQFVVTPVMEGVIVDEGNCTEILREYIRRVTTDKPRASVDAMFSIPCGASATEKQKFYNVAYSAGVSKVMLVPAPVADLLGCGINFSDFEYCALADIGSGCTDIAVLGDCGIVDGFTLNLGAVNIDMAIADHIQAKYGLKITLNRALSLKEQIGSLIPNGTKILAVEGAEVKTGVRKTINVTGFDILDALREYYQAIADSISSLISTLEAEICAKVRMQGVIFCGNGSKVEGLTEYMQNRIQIPVFLAKGARTVFGLQKLAHEKEILKKIAQK